MIMKCHNHCRPLSASILLPMITLSMPLLADENHYNNMIIGDRAMGMGGAYTAVSDDASGLYYNPAGIVYAGKRNLSASVNALNFHSITYKEVLGGKDWQRESTTFRPNFFGLVQPFGKGMVGFSYAVTDAILEDQDSQFDNLTANIEQFNINFNNEDTAVEIGPSFAMEVNENLALGATLYFHQRERKTINNSFIRLADGTFEWLNDYFQTSELGMTPVIGLVWAPADKWSLGVSMRQTILLSANSERQVTCSSDTASNLDPANAGTVCAPDPITGNARNPIIVDSDDKRDLPLQVSMGVAYFATPALLLSGDLNYFGSASEAEADRESIVNFALGLEYYLSEQWALRSGFYTNFANTPDIQAGQVDALPKVDFYGLTASLSRFTRNSSITFGFSIAAGSGESQLISGSSAIQDVEAMGGTLFLSTSYTY